MTQVNFEMASADRVLAEAIAERACQVLRARGQSPDFLSTLMDIIATHANSNPLRLADLLAADDFNLMHDVSGIAAHLNRQTGRLEGFFVPRFSDHGIPT